MKLISGMDMFSDTITFHFKDERHYKNRMGGIVSIFSFILIIFLVVLISIPFFKRTFPIILYQGEKFPYAPQLNLKEMNYELFFKFQHIPKDGKTFTYKELRNSISLKITIEYENKTFINILHEIYKAEGTEDLNYKFLFNEDIILGHANKLLFKVYFNNSLNIEDKLRFDIEFTDLMIDLYNYTSPQKNIIFNYHYMFDHTLTQHFREIDLELGNCSVITDDAWVLNNEAHDDKIFLSSISSYVSTKLEKSEPFLQGEIRASKYKQTYFRTYRKVEDFLPKLNTIVNLTFMFFRIICLHFKKNSFFLEIFNRIANFNTSYNLIDYHNKKIISVAENPQSIKSQRISKLINFKEKDSNTNSEEIINRTNNVSRLNSKSIKLINSNNYKNYFRFRDALALASFNSCFKMSKIKKSKFDKAFKLVNYYLNIDKFILKLIEVD